MTRNATIVAAALAAMALAVMAAIALGRDTPALLGVPLLLPVLGAATYVFLFACVGSGPALLAFLAVLTFINDGLFRVRDPGDVGLDWQNAMKLALWAGAFAIGVCRLRQSWPLLRGGAYIWVLAFVGYALLSSAYSESTMYSLGTAIGLAAMPLFGAALAASLGEKPILLTAVLSLVAFNLLGWVAYYVVPDLGRSLFITFDGSIVERICGLAGQANALGNVLQVYLALIFLLWYCGHLSTWLCAPLAGFGIFTLLVADSRTAFLAFIVGVVAVVLRRSAWLWGSALLGGALVSLLAMSVPLRELLSFSGGLSRSGDPTELFTLTGRTEIWAFVWDKILLSPWIGYGYNSSKFILPQFDGLPGLKVDEAHNMLLQNLLGGGVIGVAPLVILLLYLLAEFVRRPDPRRDIFTFMTLVWGVTVAGPYGSTPTVLTLAIFIGMALARRQALLSQMVATRAAAPAYARQTAPLAAPVVSAGLSPIASEIAVSRL